MKLILQIFQIAISFLLIAAILLQPKNSGLSSNSSTSGVQTQKRGAEKVVYIASIIFAVLFVLTSLAFLFVQ